MFTSFNCSTFYISEKGQEDPLYKYNKQSVYVKEKAEVIQRRYMYYPPPYRHDRVGDQNYKRWMEFVNDQHDDLTIDALLYLYHTSSNEIIQRNALHALSLQKKERLIPLWKEILKTPGELSYGFRWSAISGLERIQTQQSRQILVALFSDPMTSPEILINICRLYKENADLPDSLERILQLTNHPDENVRYAAYQVVWCDSEDARNQLIRSALADTNTEIIQWGLKAISANITPELFPDMLKFLYHHDPYIRVFTDQLLKNLFSMKYYEMCRKAFEENQWTYKDAPLLTLRYARYIEQKRGELAEAENAYQEAQHAYASNRTYNVSNYDPGATMLFRLIQVRQKLSDIEGAIEALNRLVREYPKETKVYADDFPYSWSNTRTTVGKLELLLRPILEDAPIRIHVSTLKEKNPAGHKIKFKVLVRNITNENVTLRCNTDEKKNHVLIPASLLIDSYSSTGFLENVLFSNRVDLTIAPHESFSFIGTLSHLGVGNYLVDFRFHPQCKLENGNKWKGMILANSLMLQVNE